jgi:hypothetical protein
VLPLWPVVPEAEPEADPVPPVEPPLFPEPVVAVPLGPPVLPVVPAPLEPGLPECDSVLVPEDPESRSKETPEVPADEPEPPSVETSGRPLLHAHTNVKTTHPRMRVESIRVLIYQVLHSAVAPPAAGAIHGLSETEVSDGEAREDEWAVSTRRSPVIRKAPPAPIVTYPIVFVVLA